jgi:predicted ATPase/DNA-binding winged helix-turn-helix (wHTH) protein
MDAPGAQVVFSYSVWEVDAGRRELRSGGLPVPLNDRAFDILEVLVRSAGQLVGKNELMAAAWPGVIVEENTLHAHISALRKALGEDREILKTSSGRGYRLAGNWLARQASAPPEAVCEAPSVPPEATFPTNFPAAGSGLVGRSLALQQLRTRISTSRIVTLTGPGGIGKTSLALEAARSLLQEFEGGGWVIELGSLSDPDLVPSAVARALGLKLIGGELSPETIARSLGSSKLLLLLDNCEHLIDAAARLVETLVQLCPHVSVIATSREVLRLAGEHVFHVLPLDVPPERPLASDTLPEHSAVQLFIERLQASSGEFLPQGKELQAIGAICRRLDGIPLAIEFAATRAAVLGPETVLTRLDERFALLTGGHRTALPRHQTLRATLDWSYELLSESERQLLRRLSIFAGAFTLVGATAVMSDMRGGASAVTEGIAHLAAKSFVTFDRSSPTGRWRLLETIRAYALEKLAEACESKTAARLHAKFLRDLLVPAAPGSLSQFTPETFARYRLEIDNVRAALDWAFSASGDIKIGVELAAAYAPIWMHLALSVECRERTEQALQGLKAGVTVSAALVMQLNLQHAVAMMFTMGSVDQVKSDQHKALEIAESLDDVNAQLRIIWTKWAVHYTAGQCYATREAAERFSRMAARSSDVAPQLIAERLVGAALLMSGELAAAEHRLSRVIDSYVTPQRMKNTAWAQYDSSILARALFARALCLRGVLEQAVAHAQSGLEDARSRDLKHAQCEVLRLAVCPVALLTGDLAAAEQGIAHYFEVAESLNSDKHLTDADCLHGELLVMRGEFASGVATLRAAMNALEPAGWTTATADRLSAVAHGLAALGRLDDALATLEQALAWVKHGGERWYLAELLRAKAELLLQLENPDGVAAAEGCFKRALEVAREQGALFWELRTALSLAREWHKSGRTGEAKGLLEPVYARFSEGLATPDLRAARELLESTPGGYRGALHLVK